MVFKWADTARPWLSTPWHLIHRRRFVYPSTDCTAHLSDALTTLSSIVVYWLDVYSWCKSIFGCRTPLHSELHILLCLCLSHSPFTSHFSLLLTRHHCSGRQSSLVLSSHLLFTHPSASPQGIIHAWPGCSHLSHQAEKAQIHEHTQLHQDMQAMQKGPITEQSKNRQQEC